MVPYGAGIISPLLLLSGNFYLWSARFSVTVGIFCIVLLIPYFVALRKRLSIESVIPRYQAELVEEDLLSIQGSDTLRSVETLFEGAVHLGDYDTARLAAEAMRYAADAKSEGSPEQSAAILTILKNSASRHVTNFPVHQMLLKLIFESVALSVASRGGMVSPEIILIASDSALDSVAARSPAVTEDHCNQLAVFAEKLISRNAPELAMIPIGGLRKIATRASDLGLGEISAKGAEILCRVDIDDTLENGVPMSREIVGLVRDTSRDPLIARTGIGALRTRMESALKSDRLKPLESYAAGLEKLGRELTTYDEEWIGILAASLADAAIDLSALIGIDAGWKPRALGLIDALGRLGLRVDRESKTEIGNELSRILATPSVDSDLGRAAQSFLELDK